MLRRRKDVVKREQKIRAIARLRFVARAQLIMTEANGVFADQAD